MREHVYWRHHFCSRAWRGAEKQENPFSLSHRPETKAHAIQTRAGVGSREERATATADSDSGATACNDDDDDDDDDCEGGTKKKMGGSYDEIDLEDMVGIRGEREGGCTLSAVVPP